MYRLLLTVIISVSALRNAQAQQSCSFSPSCNLFVRELILHDLESTRDQVRLEETARANARAGERDFIVKAEEFVRRWTAFANEYNDRRTFNVKAARDLSKAFHEMERSEGWPRFVSGRN